MVKDSPASMNYFLPKNSIKRKIIGMDNGMDIRRIKNNTERLLAKLTVTPIAGLHFGGNILSSSLL